MSRLPPRSRALRHMRHLLAIGVTAQVSACETSDSMVCDPMPDPLVCDDDPSSAQLANSMSLAVLWTQTEAGFDLSFDAQLYTYDAALAFSGAPIVIGATLGPVEQEGDTLSFTCTPDPGAEQVLVEFPIMCRDVAEAIRLVVDVTGQPENGASVTYQYGE